MLEPYEELVQRVEKYFEVPMHGFTKAKHNLDCCGVCFFPLYHPVHLES